MISCWFPKISLSPSEATPIGRRNPVAASRAAASCAAARADRRRGGAALDTDRDFNESSVVSAGCAGFLSGLLRDLNPEILFSQGPAPRLTPGRPPDLRSAAAWRSPPATSSESLASLRKLAKS